MSSGPGVQKNTDGGWVRDMMENQAKYNRQVAGVQDPPQGTYGDTWTGGETPPSRPSAAKNPVTRPQMRNEVSGVKVWPNESGMVGLAARSLGRILAAKTGCVYISFLPTDSVAIHCLSKRASLERIRPLDGDTIGG